MSLLLADSKVEKAHPLLGFFCGLLLLIGCDKTDPDIIAGETIVNQNCKVCHAPGLNNAPVLGNKVMWKPRAEQGLETLVQHASNGYGLMPAKGGNEALTELEITQGIKYMLSLLEAE
ncbi:c-type cytochrome [Aurantivibrio plasticivorans]